jgi:hypothetical protein
VAEIVAPDEEIAGVDDAIAIAVSIRISVAVVLLPDHVVVHVDRAAVVVVAGQGEARERQE